MEAKEKKIMGLSVGAHSLVHLFEGVLPPLIPLLIVEFGTDYFHLGLIVTGFSYAFGLGSLPAGIVSDKVGPRRLVTLFLFGAGTLSIAVWPVNSLWIYGIIMGLIGLFCSTYHPAANTLLSLSMTHRGNAFGIHGIAGSIGVAITPLLSAWIGSMFGWRTPHVFFGMAGIGLAIYSLTIPGKIISPDEKDKTRKDRAKIHSENWIRIVLFLLSATALGLTYKGIMTFLPTYMGQQVHLGFLSMDTVALGGTIATIALLSGAWGQYLAGRLVDLYDAEKLYLIAILTGMIFVFCMAISKGLILIGATVIYAFFYFATQPIQNFLISNYFPKHRHGMGYGIHFFLTFGVGSTAAAVAGYLADRFGLESVFIAMGFCFATSALMVILLILRSHRLRSKR
jgi:MFS family permease